MFYVKSDLEAAEELLLRAATPAYNVSRAEAVRCSIQMKEVGKEVRLQAEALLEVWEGTEAQQRKARMLYVSKPEF